MRPVSRYWAPDNPSKNKSSVSVCLWPYTPKRVDPAVFASYPVGQAVLGVQAHGPGTSGPLLSSFLTGQR